MMNPTIQRFISALSTGPYRAGFWVSIDSIEHHKQNNLKLEHPDTTQQQVTA